MKGIRRVFHTEQSRRKLGGDQTCAYIRKASAFSEVKTLYNYDYISYWKIELTLVLFVPII